jgi:Ca2+/H+ antiporter, TMEM165/GDT1 family
LDHYASAMGGDASWSIVWCPALDQLWNSPRLDRCFALAEIGDKTQVATVAMAAHYAAPLLVVIGTTLGMPIADVPAVFVGDKLADRIPMKLVHAVAAAIFALLGVATLLGAGAKLGF